MYMKKISSVLVIRYFERNQWKDKYVTIKNALVFSRAKFYRSEKHTKYMCV